MKSKIVLAGIIVMAAVMIASLSSVMAADYSVVLTVSNQDVVWQFDTMKLFSGKEVKLDTIVVEYWITGQEASPSKLTPYKISQADSQIKLWFNAADLPASAVKNVVRGELTTGETFVATGPGWTWGIR